MFVCGPELLAAITLCDGPGAHGQCAVQRTGDPARGMAVWLVAKAECRHCRNDAWAPSLSPLPGMCAAAWCACE